MLRRATVPTSDNQNSGLEYLLISPSTEINRDHFLQADSPYLSDDAQLDYFRIAYDSG
jgi:hypothetical protein